MDEEPRIDAELDDESQAEADPESTQHEQRSTRDQSFSAFFHGAHNFSVSGGRFKSTTNINQMAPDLPSDFRRIPMGDLDLRNEIRLVASGEVYRQDGRRSVRRVYSGRIHGSRSNMTVAVYQGDNSEEEWREDISRYSRLRHPNLVQLFGMASVCGMYTAIFNDELIPVQHLLEKYSGSHLRTVFLRDFLDTEFQEASTYTQSVWGFFQSSCYCTLWIRPSTGRLCVDLTANDRGVNPYLFGHAPSLSAVSILEPPEDSNIVDFISMDRYHEICALHFPHCRNFSVSTNALVQLGAVILWPPGSELEHPNGIAGIPDREVRDLGWGVCMGTSLTVLQWTRVDSSEVSDGNIYRRIYAKDRSLCERAWLAQANHIFHCLGITSNHDNYKLVQEIIYIMRFATANSIPSGYLFLCPWADLQADFPSHFQLPDSPAYWSLDPTGGEPLSMEEAERLGFPSPELEDLWTVVG